MSLPQFNHAEIIILKLLNNDAFKTFPPRKLPTFRKLFFREIHSCKYENKSTLANLHPQTSDSGKLSTNPKKKNTEPGGNSSQDRNRSTQCPEIKAKRLPGNSARLGKQYPNVLNVGGLEKFSNAPNETVVE